MVEKGMTAPNAAIGLVWLFAAGELAAAEAALAGWRLLGRGPRSGRAAAMLRL
jgi:hypothetical protein